MNNELLGAARQLLRPRVSGFFPNTIREAGVTCGICSTPVASWDVCYPCKQHRGPLVARRVASLAYAWKPHQSGWAMRGYKAPPQSAVEGAYEAVALLLGFGLAMHAGCAARLGGQPIEHWATVPSLPARAGDHPFHTLVTRLKAAPGNEVRLVAAPSVANPRAVDPSHFGLGGPMHGGSHVLLLDDTWVRGGHAQSAAGALLRAGAGQVSILTVARWLDPAFGQTGPFIKARLSRPDYDPERCPWTGAACP